ncbi:MAG: response regulator [Candidatus Gallimonas sp.]
METGIDCEKRAVAFGANQRKSEARRLNVVCLDDHRVALRGLVRTLRRNAALRTVVHAFDDPQKALAFVRSNGCDVFLCEIELYGSPNGLTLAKSVKKLCPQVNIIFVTVCSPNEYAEQVLELRPSGYLTKPATSDQIVSELQNLRYPVCG